MRSRCRKARAQLVVALPDRGYRCHKLPRSEFIKAGDACKCFTVFLPQMESVISKPIGVLK
jgi:hypothetical protein